MAALDLSPGTKVYLAGPMTGLPDNNFPAFHQAARDLRRRMLTVINPAELDEMEGDAGADKPWDHYLRRDLAKLVQCDVVAVLPGWMESRGASLEVRTATALGMPVVGARDLWPVKVPDVPATVAAERTRVCGNPRTLPDKCPYPATSNPQDVLRGLPADKDDRKATPITTGVIDYFPAALAEVARLSKVGNDQHNPGQPLHWARGKSTDHADCIVRHLIDRGTLDDDGVRHTAKVAWRALALLQEECEDEAGFVPGTHTNEDD